MANLLGRLRASLQRWQASHQQARAALQRQRAEQAAMLDRIRLQGYQPPQMVCGSWPPPRMPIDNSGEWQPYASLHDGPRQEGAPAGWADGPYERMAKRGGGRWV
jgi:hypothetical protein